MPLKWTFGEVRQYQTIGNTIEKKKTMNVVRPHATIASQSVVQEILGLGYPEKEKRSRSRHGWSTDLPMRARGLQEGDLEDRKSNGNGAS